MGTRFKVFCYYHSVHLSTAGDDAKVLIWDLSGPNLNNGNSADTLEPMLGYHSEEPITALQWPVSKSEWICISFSNRLQMLKV